MDDALYREEILDHYRSSAHRGHLDAPDFAAELDNPLCGDHIRMELAVGGDGTIAAVKFDGHGCALSQAGASMLAEHVEGRSLAEARGVTADAMLDLLGVRLTPTRVKCWMLAWRTMQKAIPAAVTAADPRDDGPAPAASS
jgi:nitrogen fixation NifU-like protein